MTQIEINNNVPVPTRPGRNVKHGHSAVIRDGKRSITREYSAWQQMLNRVYTGHGKQEPQVNHGILVYQPWTEDFQAFLDYMGPRPSDKHRLQRIDLSQGYVPGNLVWAVRGEVTVVTRTGQLYDYKGKQYSLVMLAKLAGMSPQAMNNRLKKGWLVEAAVDTPVNSLKRGRPRKSAFQLPGEQIIQQRVTQADWVAGRI